ncbi:hypothetical protein BT67DRAFT_159441 [Trichocladium antarcticum]|uniref:Uncharacterized protein n=1 Tax=Trichocladium antarcticum TaxID=1450529 RepID=A0AAN6UGI9_9PEZI|nr:hypothetical protein BT67DRAFT_159441 [Trichocladium antarcticum]
MGASAGLLMGVVGTVFVASGCGMYLCSYVSVPSDTADDGKVPTNNGTRQDETGSTPTAATRARSWTCVLTQRGSANRGRSVWIVARRGCMAAGHRPPPPPPPLDTLPGFACPTRSPNRCNKVRWHNSGLIP